MSGTPARAVDRALGANVPKPSASGAPWSDQDRASLRAALDAAFDGDATAHGVHAGVYAIDVRDGRALYARNADDAFQPASTLKLLTGSVALDVLGTAFRFRTELLADGTLQDGVLRGRLVLRGGGDPLLRAADLDDAAAAVAAAGITNVAGDVEIDDVHFEPPGAMPGWMLDDVPYDYAAPVDAMTLDHNAVRITATPGARPGDPVRVAVAPIGTVIASDGCAPTMHVVVLALARTGAANAPDTVDLARDGAGCIRVAGTAPAGAKADELDAAVPSPAAYAYDVLSAALQRRHIGITMLHPASTWAAGEHRSETPAAPSARVLWSHDSEPLGDLLADVWLPSDNLGAELLLREVAVARGGAPGTTANGIAAERAWLAALGIDPSAYALADGSGLSAYDRITPRALVTVLRHDWDGPNRELVLDDLPITGVRGTLAAAWRGTPAEGRVFAKTGSLTHVAALAGYVASAHHGAIAFAFDVDDALADPAALRAWRGRVLSVLAGS